MSHEILVGSKEERKDKLISYLMSKGDTGSHLLIIDPLALLINPIKI